MYVIAYEPQEQVSDWYTHPVSNQTSKCSVDEFLPWILKSPPAVTTLAVSELPSYLGRQHTRQSCYEFV